MKAKLKTLKRGQTFYGAGIQWLVLGHTNSSQGLPIVTHIVSAGIVERRAFDEKNRNDLGVSTLLAYLNGEFLERLEDAFGEGAVAEQFIDLTSNDGLKDYGNVKAKVGLLTEEEYRQHRDILPPLGDEGWWWLATPYSTERAGYPSLVRYVYSGGTLTYGIAYGGDYGVRPALNLSSSILVSDSPDSDGAYTIVWNQAPTTPPSITVPDEVRSGKTAEISWAASVDPEGGAITYELERSINSGAWTNVYTGSATSYDDTGVGTSANTVQWRVRAKDVNGAYSGYTSSTVKTVVHNVDPTISGTDTDLGTVTSPPSMAYTVNDQDTDDELTVVESLDGNEIRTIEDAVRNQTYTFALTEAQFAALSNGQHTMQVKVTDTLGNSATRTTTFTRSVTGIEYIVGPIETDTAAEKILVSLQYYAAAEDVVVSVCNNAFDDNPTWELATIGLKHIFSNSTKTAEKWGVGVKVQISKSTGYDTISSRPVSGSYV